MDGPRKTMDGPGESRDGARESNEGPADSGHPEPLPACIRFWCPADLIPFLDAGLRSCGSGAGLPPPDWRCLEILLHDFLTQAEDPALQELIARYPALDRDGWRCTVPICSQRSNLNPHHVWHRGRCGPDVMWNVTSLCFAHHIEQEHGTGAIRVNGRAPDQLTWEIGRRPGRGEPLLRFQGEVKISEVKIMNEEPGGAAGAQPSAG